MRAAFLVEPGRIEVRDVPVPRPSAGEVLVRIRAALTCGTDLKAFLRGHPLIPMPGVFGHEFSGTVASLGPGVKGFREGDQVMGVHSAPCRRCSYCRKGLHNLCEQIMTTKVLGAFAEYLLLPRPIVRQNLFHKPPALSFEEAAMLEPLSCVVHGMEGVRFGKGNKALILGSGPIGLLHLLLAQRRGAAALVAALEDDRLALARRLGAEEAVQPQHLRDAVIERTGGIGADVVFECTGQASVWEESVNYVRRGGTVVLFGGCPGGSRVAYDTSRLHYDEITLKGVFHYTPADVRKAFRLLSEGFDLSALISGTCALEDLPAAFGRLTRGEGVKYVISP